MDFTDPDPSELELSFEDRFSLMVERQWLSKKNARIERLIRGASLGINACLEDIKYDEGRNIKRKDVATLGSCTFITQKLNVIVSGKTGCGKSYLISAIGNAACRHGYSCRYYRLPELFAEVALARMENKYLRFMESLRKIHLLILDDIGLKSYSFEESRDLLELAELRYNRTSTIFASQVPHEKWYELIGDPTLADAFMDRVVHNAFIIALDSKVSMREVMARKKMEIIEMSNEN